MKLSDARKILSGELVFLHFAFTYDSGIFLNKKTGGNEKVNFGRRGIKFALRQLALKVEREHKKARE